MECADPYDDDGTQFGFPRCTREGCGHLWSEHAIPNRMTRAEIESGVEGCRVCECDAHLLGGWTSNDVVAELDAKLAAVTRERDVLLGVIREALAIDTAIQAAKAAVVETLRGS